MPHDIDHRPRTRTQRAPGAPRPGDTGQAGAPDPHAPQNPPPMLVTVEQAAAALGISRTAVFALIRTRQLRTVKIGCRRRVPVSALHDYVADLISAAEPA